MDLTSSWFVSREWLQYSSLSMPHDSMGTFLGLSDVTPGEFFSPGGCSASKVILNFLCSLSLNIRGMGIL